MRQSGVVLKFLGAVERDLADGGLRPVERYLEEFPEDADLVRREYDRLLASSEAASGSGDVRVIDDRYEIVQSLGRGGFAEVLLARDRRMGREVAVKCLTGARSYGREWRARLVREAHAANRIPDPGFCPIHDVGFKSDGSPFLVMPWIQGRSLDRLIAASASRGEGPVLLGDATDVEDRLRRFLLLVESMARSLDAAHRVGVVHRDVKPANVIVRPDGTPVIIDLGLASLDQDPDAANLSGALGTPAYAAPELLASEPAAPTPAVDIWSLGVVLFEGLMLRRPFAAGRGQSLEKAILEGPVPRVDDRFGRDLQAVLECALQVAPEKRYPSMQAFAEDLYRVRTGEPVSVRPLGVAARAARWAWRHRARLSLAAAACVLAISAAAVAAALRTNAKEREAVEGVASSLAASTIADVERLRIRGVPLTERVKPLHALVASVRELRDVIADSPSLDRVLAQALAEVGALEVQLGRCAEAQQVLREARRIWRHLIASGEGSVGDRAGLAHAVILCGDAAHHAGEDAEASRLYREAQDVDLELLASAPDDATRISNVGFGWVRIGHQEREAGQYDRAVETVRRGVDVLRRAAALEPEADRRRWDVAKAQVELVGCLSQQQQQHAKADLLPLVTECEATCRAWVRAQPLNAEAWSYLRSVSFHFLACATDREERITLAARMVDFAERVFAIESAAPLVRLCLANTLMLQSTELSDAQRHAAAADAADRAIAVVEGAAPRSEDIALAHQWALLQRAALARRLGDDAGARAWHDEAVARAEARRAADPTYGVHLLAALMAPGFATLEHLQRAAALVDDLEADGAVSGEHAAALRASIADLR